MSSIGHGPEGIPRHEGQQLPAVPKHEVDYRIGRITQKIRDAEEKGVFQRVGGEIRAKLTVPAEEKSVRRSLKAISEYMIGLQGKETLEDDDKRDIKAISDYVNSVSKQTFTGKGKQEEFESLRKDIEKRVSLLNLVVNLSSEENKILKKVNGLLLYMNENLGKIDTSKKELNDYSREKYGYAIHAGQQALNELRELAKTQPDLAKAQFVNFSKLYDLERNLATQSPADLRAFLNSLEDKDKALGIPKK